MFQGSGAARPTLAETQAISALADPALRNLRITSCYHRLSAALAGARPFSVVDMPSTCDHHYSMSTMIQIRNVPEEVHRAAKARAALEGMTLSDLALRALEREVRRPTLAEIAARVRLLPPVTTDRSPAALVREERDSR